MLKVNFFKQFLILCSFLSVLAGCGNEIRTSPGKTGVSLQIAMSIDNQYRDLLSTIINHELLGKIKPIEKVVIWHTDKNHKNLELLLVQNGQNSDNQSSKTPQNGQNLNNQSSKNLSAEYIFDSQQRVLERLISFIVIIIILATLIVIGTVIYIFILWSRKYNQNLNNTIKNSINNQFQISLVPLFEPKLIALQTLLSEQEKKLSQVGNKLQQLSNTINSSNFNPTPIVVVKEIRKNLDTISNIFSQKINAMLKENSSTSSKAYEAVLISLNQLSSNIESLKRNDNVSISQEVITELQNKLVPLIVNSLSGLPSNAEELRIYQSEINEISNLKNQIRTLVEKLQKQFPYDEDSQSRYRQNDNIIKDLEEEITRIQKFQQDVRRDIKDILEYSKEVKHLKSVEKLSEEIRRIQESQRDIRENIKNILYFLNDSQKSQNQSNSDYLSYKQQNFVSTTSSASNLFPPPDLLKTYGSDPYSLEQKVTKVSPTEESLLRRRNDYSEPIIFESKPNGNYWVVSRRDSNQDLIHWLFPTPNMEINEYTSATINFLFEGLKGALDKANHFKLIKPARVSNNNLGHGDWQLEERGELNLISG